MNRFDNVKLTDSEQERINNSKTYRNIDELIRMLDDQSWVVRRSVVESLAKIGNEAITPLCEILLHDRKSEAKLAATVDALVASVGDVEERITALSKNNDPYIVTDIAQVLGRRRDSSSVKTLIELTRHPDDNVGVMAIEGLGRIGGRAAVEALIITVEEGNFFRTFPAIDVLGKSGDPRAVAPLTKLLANPSYLPEAARALGKSGEKGAVSSLTNLLSSTSDAIIRTAATALQELLVRFEEKSGGEIKVIEEMIRSQMSGDIVRRLARSLNSADSQEAIAISELLGIFGSDEAEPALATLLNSEPVMASAAAKALKRIGKNSEMAILQALRESSGVRRKVLLPLISKQAAAIEVVNCLQDPDSDVRAIACDTLGRLGNPAVVKDIFPLLKDSNLRVVHSATAAIQSLGSRESRTLAAEWFKTENPIVRRACLRILTYFGDNTALEPMLAGLEDTDLRVREAAVQGLPYLEDSKAITALNNICKDTDPRMRSLAMRSLGQLPKSSELTLAMLLRGLKDADAWVRYYAVQSVGRLAYSDVAEEVVKLLDDPAGQVRVSAVEALSHLNHPKSNEAMKAAAVSDDVEVKRAALLGLGISHRPEDLEIVLDAASSADSPTRLIALSALINFTSPKVLGALSAAVSDEDPQIISAAIELLASFRGQEATEILIDLLSDQEHKIKAQEALLVANEGRISGILLALEHSDDELSVLLVSILSRIKRTGARTALIAAMGLVNVAARKAAASGLSARRDPEMMAVLQEASEVDPDQGVREICKLLLRQ